MKVYNIAVCAGDGIGPEVVSQTVRLLELVAERSKNKFVFNFQELLLGGAAIDATGSPLPDVTFEACKAADAILVGAVGGYKWPVHLEVRPEQGLLALRKKLELFANIRPAKAYSESLISASPLKDHLVKNVDILVLRELTGGLYFGDRKEPFVEPRPEAAWDTMIYTVDEIKRVTRVAAELALTTNPPMVIHSVDKANVLASSRLWRKVVSDTLQNEYPQIKVDHSYVDAVAMVLVTNPARLNGVLVTENMFGDILSDQTSGIPGSIGFLPSASLAGPPSSGDETVLGLYEPVHGSAPDIAGQGIANPIATMLSAAMLLRYSLGLHKEADSIEQAIRVVLDDKSIGGLGLRTRDLGGNSTTAEISERVLFALKTLPPV